LVLPLGALLDGWRSWNRNVRPWLKHSLLILTIAGIFVQVLAITVDWQLQYELMNEREATAFASGRYIWEPALSPVAVHALAALQIASGTAEFPKSKEGSAENNGRPKVNTLDFWWVYLWYMDRFRPLILTVLAALALAGGSTSYWLWRSVPVRSAARLAPVVGIDY